MNPIKALITFIVMLLALFGAPSNSYAQCSADYYGLASINEIHRSGNSTRFVEVKLLNSALTSSDYDQWAVQVCGNGGGCTGNISLSTADDSNLPWITIPKSAILSQNYINFRDGTDVIFKDGNGHTIDYVSAESYTPQRDASCSSAYPWEINSNNTTHTASRHPDGTGAWVEESGNSGDYTPGDDNEAGGITGPDIFIADTAVMQGETATLTVTLSAIHSDAITFTYETQDNTAQAGVDYQFVSGVGSISVGQLTTTVTVPTFVTGNTSPARFYVSLTSASNASITGQLGIVTIIPPVTGQWQMEQGSWNGSFGEVLDSSANALHGTARSGATTDDVNPDPARAGDPGTCRYGEFDGANQYVEIADNSTLDLKDELTVAVWINPDQIPGSGLKSILSKDENYEFHLEPGGDINWWWNSRTWRDHWLWGWRWETDTRSFSTSGANIQAGNWYHIAITYRSGEQVIYINGEAVESRTYPDDELITNNDPLHIGGDQGFSGRYFDGQIDEVQIYSSALHSSAIKTIYQQTHPCSATSPSLDHFDITVPSTGSTCTPVSVLISAIDTNGDVITGYAGTVDISASSNQGNWSKQTADGNLSPDPDDDDNGAVQYAFAATDNGEITLNLENTHADALTIKVEDSAESVQSESSKITFSDNVLVISENDTLDYDVVAGRDHQFKAVLWTKDNTSGLCSINENYNGLIDLKAWITKGPDFDGGANPELVEDIEVRPMITTQPSSSNITLDFTSGQASFLWRTTDVAQHILNLLDDSSGFVVDEFGVPLSIASSSEVWAVRPFGFYLEAIDNPKAEDADGIKYLAAGEDFKVNVTAVLYQSADDKFDVLGNSLPDGDGFPDGHANSNPFDNVDLSDNSVALSFGLEGESADMLSILYLPSGGNDSQVNLTVSSGEFSSGIATVTTQFNEVGIIEIKASLSNPGYLNNLANVYGASGVVGRFYPHHFEVSIADSSFQVVCSPSFTYMDQPFLFMAAPTVKITAKNKGGTATTENYQDTFWKLGNSLELDGSCSAIANSTKGFCYSDNVAGEATLSTPDTVQLYPNISTAAGTVTLTLHNTITDEFNYGRPNAGLVAPFDADVQLAVQVEDSDEVSGSATLANIGFSGDTDATGSDLNLTNDEYLRYGRWRMENVFGPEISALAMPAIAEYYNVSGDWQTSNDDDSTCTSLSMTNAKENIFISSDPAGTGSSPEDAIPVDTATTDFSYNSSLMSGDGNFLFSPLSIVGKSGSVRIAADLSELPWLRFDWDGNGSFEDAPDATATFGRYRGHDRIIYWR